MGLQDIEITWLASYPKSGNTWLRFFLSALVFGRSEDSTAVIDNIPEIGSGSNEEAYRRSGPTLIKTHIPYSDLEPLHARTDSFIYIVRNPMDVLLSSYNYHRLQMGTPIDISEDKYLIRYARHFLTHGGEERWTQHGYGTLQKNVDDWTEVATQRHPHLIIRYEDMLQVPELVARALCTFLKIPKSDREIADALEFASFKNMRAMEEKEIKTQKKTFFTGEIAGIGHQEGRRFMNRGEANRHYLLPPDIRQQVRQMFQKTMRQYCYS